jgi:hypothetical protein
MTYLPENMLVVRKPASGTLREPCKSHRKTLA